MNYNHGGNVYKHLRESGGSLTELLDFSANINPLGLSPVGQKAMESAYEQLLHYPDPEYVTLRKALSDYYDVPMTWLAVYNGAAEAMHAYFRYLNPKKALLHGPGFVEYEKILEGLGVEVQWVILEEAEGFSINRNRYLEDLNRHKPDLAVICSPNNPTGQKVSIEYLKVIESTLKTWGGTLAIDEAFIEFSEEEASYSSQLTELSRVVIFKSLTKFFGVPGLRLGALVNPIADFHKWDQTFGVPWRVNSFAESYALGAVTDKNYIDQTKEYIVSERHFMQEQLKGISALRVFPSDADYLLLKSPASQFDQLVAVLSERHILVRDCSNYRGLSKGFFRVAIKSHEANIKLVEAIKEVFDHEG